MRFNELCKFVGVGSETTPDITALNVLCKFVGGNQVSFPPNLYITAVGDESDSEW